ncbi:MAG TPA: SRPBCC domain-containing protein [Devosiaceae bacterium]|jgi:uncharacterized protein YndB with AHSA1/START domain|nr:SRPBCC domain-containing protein [Devosiaceae bacterium]
MSEARGLVVGAAVMVMTTAVSGAYAESYDLAVSRIIEAPVEQVWEAWSDGSRIRQWWGPSGFSAPVADVDFNVGSRSIVCMQPPDGPLMCNSWTYTEIVPNERIAFDAGWVDEAGNEIDPRSMGLPDDIPSIVPHIITFRPLSDSKTELTVSEFGYGSEATVALSKAGLEQVLDKLEASLE